ncbi:unnamed protein product [Eruca vesicaria subsp. sativa]|uniref:Uncharacterized protein n=1 Tax=Eruca vesicaria subsp. sativa TaxID=29727 RepID=A0ABC8JRQ3_ERUVS|nr:unnamed protein product [Eruca vesicaria subsp. sativa]
MSIVAQFLCLMFVFVLLGESDGISIVVLFFLKVTLVRNTKHHNHWNRTAVERRRKYLPWENEDKQKLNGLWSSPEKPWPWEWRKNKRGADTARMLPLQVTSPVLGFEM